MMKRHPLKPVQDIAQINRLYYMNHQGQNICNNPFTHAHHGTYSCVTVNLNLMYTYRQDYAITQ